MHCPFCVSKDTKVTDSREGTEGFSIRRRRECEKCGFRFSTVEEAEILDLTVIKRNGSREIYDKEKIANGLAHSLEKRPYTNDQFKKLLQKIERDIQRRKKNEITSGEIGEIVMKHLKSFDQVGYIRFASVYRSFQDIESFTRELQDLIEKPKNKKRRKKRTK